VPWANDVNVVFRKLKSSAGLILGNILFYALKYFSLADGASLVGAMIFISMKLSLDTKDADFETILGDDPTPPLLEFGFISQINFRHVPFSPELSD
jgi:hypothetical protein